MVFQSKLSAHQRAARIAAEERYTLFAEFAALRARSNLPWVSIVCATACMLLLTTPLAAAAPLMVLIALVSAIDARILRSAAERADDRAAVRRQYRLALLSSGVLVVSVALVCIVVWTHAETNSRMLVAAYLFGAGLNAALQISLFPTAAIFRGALYLLVIVGLFGSSITMGSAPWDVLRYELLGIGALLFWGALFVVHFISLERHNRRMRAELRKETARTERAYSDLSRKQEELRRLSLVARYARDSVMVSDADGRILWTNDAFTRITGFSRAEAIGRHPADFLASEGTDIATSEMIDQHIRMGEPVRTQILNQRRDGTEFWLDVQKVPILDDQGNVELVIAVDRDVTEDRKRERDLAEAKVAAEQGARAKSEFLATMSHEIRTPMNGILGMADLLQDAPLDDERRAYVETIRSSSEALLKIINDILDLSKLDAGHIELESQPFRIADCVGDVLALLKPEARNKGLTLDTEMPGGLPAVLQGDAGRIRQILVNLVGNALKFTDTGGVRLVVEAEATEAGVTLSVSVHDTGIGVPEDRLDAIFAEFAQADGATTRRFGGTGLGLTISRRMARAMGGDISVVSKPGEGSVFKLTLPLAAAASGEMPPPDIAGPRPGVTPGDRLRVLVAEDNRTNRLLIERFLASEQIDLSFARDGVQAVRAFRAERPDVILMDMSMPEMDGLEATRRIRAMGGPQPRIIALTANAFDSDRQACFDAGMDDFLSKPVRRADLLAKLAETSRPAA